MMATMTSKKPYLIRACYDWIVDNDLTPYVLVNANYPGIDIPLEHVSNGRILLNMSPNACRGLHLENDRILFTARFAGVATQIFIYPAAVLAIYAKENGEGMEFPDEGCDDLPPPKPSTGKDKSTRTKPSLKLVE
jgi:stringent starvation protein B